MINYVTINKMIKSSDKENSYLAACILREDLSEKNKKLLSKIPLEVRIHNYADICKELSIKEFTIEDFNFLGEQAEKQLAYHQILNIQKLVNDGWKVDLNDSNQKKYYPWFHTGSGGVVFHLSGWVDDVLTGQVAFYKDEETSNFVGKTFLNIYKILIG